MVTLSFLLYHYLSVKVGRDPPVLFIIGFMKLLNTPDPSYKLLLLPLHELMSCQILKM